MHYLEHKSNSHYSIKLLVKVLGIKVIYYIKRRLTYSGTSIAGTNNIGVKNPYNDDFKEMKNQ